MAVYKRFEDLDCWQKARELAKYVFKLTQKPDFSKDFGHKSQINDAAGSVMDNISEGFGRGGNREFNNFLSIARGSCCEVKSQIYRAFDKEYISKEELEHGIKLSESTLTSITNFNTFIKKNIETGFRNS